MAQAVVPASQVRALNSAHNTAFIENGGFSVYRPQSRMFQASADGEDPGRPEDGSNDTAEHGGQVAPEAWGVERPDRLNPLVN